MHCFHSCSARGSWRSLSTSSPTWGSEPARAGSTAFARRTPQHRAATRRAVVRHGAVSACLPIPLRRADGVRWAVLLCEAHVGARTSSTTDHDRWAHREGSCLRRPAQGQRQGRTGCPHRAADRRPGADHHDEHLRLGPAHVRGQDGLRDRPLVRAREPGPGHRGRRRRRQGEGGRVRRPPPSTWPAGTARTASAASPTIA